MTIVDQIASLYLDYTIAHNARPTKLRLTKVDEDALGSYAITCLYAKWARGVLERNPPRFLDMEIEFDAPTTEVL